MSLNHWFKLTHKRGISPSMTRIFSILVCNNLLRMIKLSRLGSDFPAIHLQIACGFSKPNAPWISRLDAADCDHIVRMNMRSGFICFRNSGEKATQWKLHRLSSTTRFPFRKQTHCLQDRILIILNLQRFCVSWVFTILVTNFTNQPAYIIRPMN